MAAVANLALPARAIGNSTPALDVLPGSMHVATKLGCQAVCSLVTPTGSTPAHSAGRISLHDRRAEPNRPQVITARAPALHYRP